jgi:hypothetical protein
MSAIIAKLLAYKLLRKIGKLIVIRLLTEYVNSTDNKIDNAILEDVKEALK